LAIIGSAYVDIRALDNHLQRDIDNAMKKVKEPLITLQSNVNLQPVRDKIKVLREELKRNPLKFTAEVDDSKIVESLADAHQLYEDNPLTVVSTTDTSPLESALQDVREQFGEFSSTVSANANTAIAEAQMRALTRARSVNVFPRIIDADIRRAMGGITTTLMGAIPAEKVKAAIVGVLANFESLTIGAAKAMTVVGSLGAMALTTGSDILTLGGDISRTVGILSMIPAVFTTFGVGIAALKLGFKDFAGALSSDAKKSAEAMAKLPLEAQKAAQSLKGTGSEIRKSSQAEFWKELGTSIQEFMKPAFRAIKEGMEGASKETAKFVKGTLLSFQEFAENGGMDKLFLNINKGLAAASGAAKPFFDALNTISLTGSKHLERYGTKLTEVATRFDAWATRVSESGEMDQWITQAEANMSSLWKITGETVNIFEGLTQAAAKAGGKSLADVAEGLQNIAGVVNSAPFQTKLVEVLLGARAGVEALGRGFDSIKGVISGGTSALSGFLNLAGQIGGSFMTNIAAMFEGTGMSAGIIEAMDGAKQAMDIMKPAFSDFGAMIGDIGDIASVLFVNMAPGFVNLADTLQKVVAALKTGVEAVIPVFNVFIQNILMIIAPVIIGIADAIGNLLEGFAALPEVIRNAIMAFGLFLAVLKLLQRPMMDTRTGMRNLASPIQNIQDRITGLRDSVARTWNTNGSIGAVRGAFTGLVSQASVASGAVGRAFQQMGWMGSHSAQVISDGFKRSFSQLGGELSKLGTPIKEFSSMMGRAMGEALFPQEVRDGFRQVGTKLADVARIYTGYFTAAKDKIAEIGKSIASVFPASLLGPALKALPGEVGRTLAFAGQKVAEGISNVAKIIAGPAVGYAMTKMRDVIATQALYASKHLENIGKGMRTAVEAVKAAPAVVGAALGRMAESAKQAFSYIQQSVATAFNSGVLAAAVHPLTAPFALMADAARTGAIQAAQHVSNMAKSIGTAINTMTVPARAAFAGLAVAASIQAGVITDRFKIAADRISGNLVTGFRNAARDLSTVGSNISDTMGRAFNGVQNAATTAATVVTDRMRAAASSIATNFAPAVAAVRGTFDGIRTAVGPAVTSIGDLGRSAGNAAGAVGQLAGATARWAGAGLLDAMGGGWGLAIAGATAVITALADAEAKSKARIEAFTATLDAQTGAVTNLTKTLMIKSLFDGVTDQWDDFVRGVVKNSKTVAETLEALGMDNKKYLDTMADPSARSKMISAMDEIEAKLRGGQQVSKELAEAAGMSVEALTGLNAFEANNMANSLDHATDKAEDMAKELKRAEEQVRLTASATGLNSAEAAIMSKNYDVLANSTSSVSDKLSALQENMRLVGTDQEKAALGQKGYQQSLRDTADKIKAIGEANTGIFLPSLFEVGKGFDFTKQAGADLHSALEGQVEGIQKLGAEGIQKALAEGKKGEDVQRAALNAMQPAIDSLKANLKDLGFDDAQIQGIIDTFNLMPKDIETSISLSGAEAARKEIALTALAAGAFARGDYEATLAVLPGEAKKAIEDATGLAGAFARKDYKAILGALDKTEGGKEGAIANLLTVVDGKWEAELTAMDLSKDKVDAAKAKIQTEWADKVHQAKLSADPAEWERVKEAATQAGYNFEGTTFTSKMASDASAFELSKQSAVTSGDEFGSKTFRSILDGDRSSFEYQRDIAKVYGEDFANSIFKSTIDGNGTPFEIAKQSAVGSGTQFGATTFKSTVDGNNNPFNLSISGATSTGDGFSGKDFKATASVNDQASGPLSGILTALGSIGGFVAEATVNVRKFFTGESAEGSINDGKNWHPDFAPKIKEYANGGIERHVAQIAKPSSTVRIWAEPETHGEAYIPLSKAKRPRSLKILEEVAEQFGFSLVKRLEFANGGILKSVQSATESPFKSTTRSESTMIAAATSGSGASTIVNYNVHPSQGLSEKQIAEASMSELYWQLSSR
jgi:hypothetical protein